MYFEIDYVISAETDNFEFLHIRISLSSKFFPEQTNLNFWTKYAQKRYLGSKTEKVNIPIEFCILELVKVPNFSLN